MLKLRALNAKIYGELTRLLMEFSGFKYEFMPLATEGGLQMPVMELMHEEEPLLIKEIYSLTSFIGKIGGLLPNAAESPIECFKIESLTFHMITMYCPDE